jgi:hypothetical protein
MSEDALRETAAADCAEEGHSSPYAALADEIYRDRVIRARSAAPEEKILAGQRLFESACRITLAGIRNQNPGLSEEQCRQILRDRLAWRRRREKAG